MKKYLPIKVHHIYFGYGWWYAEDGTFFHINPKYFPEVTFENSPKEVEIVIKK